MSESLQQAVSRLAAAVGRVEQSTAAREEQGRAAADATAAELRRAREDEAAMRATTRETGGRLDATIDRLRAVLERQ